MPGSSRPTLEKPQADRGAQRDVQHAAGPPSHGRAQETSLLEARDVHVFYGSIEALKGVSVAVSPGEIVALIGANGAGKTTVLRTISGLLRPTRGTIWFENKRIDQLPAHRIVEIGIGHAPEGRRVFGRLSIIENLRMGVFARRDGAGVAQDLERVFLLFPVLKERRKQQGGTLSGGEQQMLAIGRALMTRPKVLMLDEPSMGLAPLILERIFETISEIKRQGITILLVEQNAQMALSLADRGYVLESGEIALTGTGEALLRNEQVRKAYLGED